MPTRRCLWICEKHLSAEERFVYSGLQGFSIEPAEGILDGLERLSRAEAEVDVVVARFPAPDWTPEEFLEQAHSIDALVPIIIRDPDMCTTDAVQLARLGAYQCLGAEVDAGELIEVLESAASERQALTPCSAHAPEEPWKQCLAGQSRAIEDVARIIRLVGPRRCTVLITGETGTGKEMVARALHMASPRSRLPMVAVNCSALPENLLEAELFGHVKGAFTGAVSQRAGRFEQANNSTLFLDEIGEMPFELQAKLLRVLQEREFQRLGSSETIKVDVRVVAASNVDLLEKVRRKEFREDLYYRLNVVPIQMPPLRERATDIPILVHHFIDKICRLEGVPPKQVGPGVIERLCSFSWPGNVRQLENAVEMAIILSGERTTLCPGDFPVAQPADLRVISLKKGASSFVLPEDGLDFDWTVKRFERDLLMQALEKSGGNKTLAAEMLGLKRTTLLAKLRGFEAAGEAQSYAIA